MSLLFEPGALRGLLHRLYIQAPGAGLRNEEEKKCLELAGFLAQIALVLRRSRRSGRFRVVDAAAGKGYVGLCAAALLSHRMGLEMHVTFIERDEARGSAIQAAADVLGFTASQVDVRCCDVAEPSAWPDQPDLVTALHACGDATDRTIEAAARAQARWMLVAPCCVASWLPAARRAEALAARLGLPPLAEIRRRHVEAHVLADRVWLLESLGWQTEAAAFVKPTVTPYNVVLRSRRVMEPERMRRAAHELARRTASDQTPTA